MAQIYHQDNFGTNLTSNVLAGATTSPLNSIPSVSAPFYLAFDATNINGHYEVRQITSKTATNVNHAALSYNHTTAEEVRLVLPAVELDDISQKLNAGDYFYSGITRQAIMNGNFDIWQRGTTFTPNDDTFIADRWNFLTEVNASWTITPDDTDVPSTKSHQSLKAVKQATGVNSQMAIVQFLEHVDTKKLTGGTCSVSFAAKTQSLQISNLRAAVMTWHGTADTLTSDVISSWGQDGVNPTFAVNWATENAITNNALTNSWQTFTIENISLNNPATNNLALIIWTDDGTIATGDTFWISQVQLCAGDVALPFQPKSVDEELRACMRYYETGEANIIGNASASGYLIGSQILFHTRKRITPTVNMLTATENTNFSSTTQAPITVDGFRHYGVATAAGSAYITRSYTADAEL